MSQQNIKSVEDYFSALKAHDLNEIEQLFDDNVREVIPLAPNGAPEPWVVYDGKRDVLGYVAGMFQNFSTIEVTDRVFNVSDNGKTVFVEAKGDLVHADSGCPYRNVYVFKFTFEVDGKIVEILEYANPIPIALLLNVPLG